jgi:hypothetical protein
MPRKPKHSSEYPDDGGSVKKSVSLPKDLLVRAEARFRSKRVKTLSGYIQILIEDDTGGPEYDPTPVPLSKTINSGGHEQSQERSGAAAPLRKASRTVKPHK